MHFFLCKAGESMMFNTFIQETKERLINQRGHEFWLLMVKGKMQSITDCFIVYVPCGVIFFYLKLMNLFHAFHDRTENVKMITEAEATDSTVTETQAKEVS